MCHQSFCSSPDQFAQVRNELCDRITRAGSGVFLKLVIEDLF